MTKMITDKEINDFILSGGTPYYKATRKLHSSGYRCFEIGYMKSGANNKCEKKIVLGNCCDHIGFDYGVNILNLNIDMTPDGYVRFFTHDRKIQLIWAYNFIGSDAILTIKQ